MCAQITHSQGNTRFSSWGTPYWGMELEPKDLHEDVQICWTGIDG